MTSGPATPDPARNTHSSTDLAAHAATLPDPARHTRRRRVTRLLLAAGITAVSASAVIDPILTAAALATGILNTAGGGGAVITFVALTAAGVPALTAHATSQVLTPMSFLTGLRTMRHHRPDPRWILAGAAGAVAGVAVLALTPPDTFARAAPWCLLPAAALVIAQEPIRRLAHRTGWSIGPHTSIIAVFVCGAYAGMIGVGTGTLAVAVLGLVPAFLCLPLPTLLRTRNILLLIMSIVVSAVFAITGLADWYLVALLAIPAAAGGWLGTTVIHHAPPWALRSAVVVCALAGTVWMITQP